MLANAVCQSTHLSLTHRIREQARSHNSTEFGHQTNVLCFAVGAGLPAMQAHWSIRYTELMPSQASQLPHLMEFSLQDQIGCQAAAHNFTEFGHQTTVLCFSVGAGLPAMQATRYIRQHHC